MTKNSKDQTLEVNNIDVSQEDNKVKKEQSREEKKRARKAALRSYSPLELSDESKEHGYVYRIANVLPGNLETYKSMGYEIVSNKMTTNLQSVSTPELSNESGEFEVGRANGSMKAVWIRTTQDNYDILREIEDDKAKEQYAQIEELKGTPGISGTITKENLK